MLTQQLLNFNKLNKEFNEDIKLKFERLKLTENVIIESSNNTNTNTNTNANKDNQHQLIEKINAFEKNLDEKFQENIEIESNFNKKLASFRTQIELDENKFNQENLKTVKVDIDNLDNILREKIKTTSDEYDKLVQIFNSNKEKSIN